VGEVAEVYVQAVMRAFDGREVDGAAYFNHAGPIPLPRFERVERRGGIVKAGVPIEVSTGSTRRIDLTGEWTIPEQESQAAWLVQVKYTQTPIGEEAVQHFLAQTQAVMAEEGYATLTRWYFCKACGESDRTSGYTGEAARALKAAGVLYSDLEQFNALANLFDFFGLPRGAR
jgi:hypothetical protein